MKPVHLHIFTSFIFNTNVKTISNIFNQLPDWQIEALQSREKELREKYDGQNRLIWLDLISEMDEEQKEILISYIENLYTYSI